MTLRLKTNLLIEILSPTTNPNKYSKSLLNLKTIIKLEDDEDFKLPKSTLKLYTELLKREDNFISGIPLILIEREFYLKNGKLNNYINIQYKTFEITISAREIFILLEKFYNELFLIASLIASYYNLEIKINNAKNDKDLI